MEPAGGERRIIGEQSPHFVDRSEAAALDRAHALLDEQDIGHAQECGDNDRGGGPGVGARRLDEQGEQQASPAKHGEQSGKRECGGGIDHGLRLQS